MEFLSSLSKIYKDEKSVFIKTKRGKGGGTYGNKQVVLEYAQYLDTDLAVLVNEVFFQRSEDEKSPDRYIDKAHAAYKRMGKSDEWIQKRIISKLSRNHYTDVLKAHDVSGNGYGMCTNAIYIPLFNGGADVIRRKKNLPGKANVRDNMSLLELSAVNLSGVLASDSIDRFEAYGNTECSVVSKSASSFVADAIMKHREFIGNKFDNLK